MVRPQGGSRGVRADTPRETENQRNRKKLNDRWITRRSDGVPWITMHHWKDLDEPDLLDPSIIWISEGGPS